MKIEIESLGNLRTKAVPCSPQATVLTDASREDGGAGEAFGPTDLVGVALASCILTVVEMVAKRNDIDLTGTKVEVDKEMSPQRRIGRLRLTIRVPAHTAAKMSDGLRDKLERVATHCPVHNSLHPDVQQEIVFDYGAGAVS